ncbi:hypothetical protein B0I72DRAFT_161936 [Yarrowia lipolytica]|uniref:Uncharacterized protein n=1 Tax=Yarrowia lipolytica TaxID=4952 RepID=A0A371CED7_YARLL|nr:hypothetical protein B0I71DRAFT_171257 [Yarrowia lipolytica]RDW31015.1 hypothetical protein B0I72DRAFT_161936 [Yarrowia lipolytica]RDW37676.1 hypothetical protein B0I73DRAFT_162760 [Yarrowia lipolytica]RDW45096.1 hypothetical protein B0I74DRAFT_164236 [Yarrowia lipolytica]RDW52145.1 hypothetical protein B0I75DRAFT_169562 [Yarrowia lipolytica]
MSCMFEHYICTDKFFFHFFPFFFLSFAPDSPMPLNFDSYVSAERHDDPSQPELKDARKVTKKFLEDNSLVHFDKSTLVYGNCISETYADMEDWKLVAENFAKELAVFMPTAKFDPENDARMQKTGFSEDMFVWFVVRGVPLNATGGIAQDIFVPCQKLDDFPALVLVDEVE